MRRYVHQYATGAGKRQVLVCAAGSKLERWGVTGILTTHRTLYTCTEGNILFRSTAMPYLHAHREMTTDKKNNSSIKPPKAAESIIENTEVSSAADVTINQHLSGEKQADITVEDIAARAEKDAERTLEAAMRGEYGQSGGESFGMNFDQKGQEGAENILDLDEAGNADMAELMKEFLEKNPQYADLVDDDNEEGPPVLEPLISAAFNGALDEIKVLIATGAVVDAKDKDGWTALMAGASEGKTNCVEYLLTAGAQVDGRDNDGWTALMLAAEYNHLSTVSVLVTAGADVNGVDFENKTALMHAVVDNQLESVQLLCQLGADVTLVDKYNGTARKYAAELGHEELAKFLEKMEAPAVSLK